MSKNKIIQFVYKKLNLDKSVNLRKFYHLIMYAKFRIIKIIFKKRNGWIKTEDLIEKILSENYLIGSGMVWKNDLRIILNNLKIVLDNNIEGDIVELGCNIGTTSVFIERLLQEYLPRRKFHVYDSFEGLPEKSIQDETIQTTSSFNKGSCKTKIEFLIFNFKMLSLRLPKIHIGWFGEISDKEYPEKIAFAFFDGDFYSSIMDSFKKVYPKLSPLSRLAIHDYGHSELPWVERACDDFLANKPEKWTILKFENLAILTMK